MKASESYSKQCSEVAIQIAELQQKLDLHSKKQLNDSGNWGYVGDIGHIRESLEQLNKFL